MASEPLIRRAHVRGSMMSVSRMDRVLGHPLAFVLTTAILIAIFGWTFFANPGRPAAADDPAYYHWRTEALLANEPDTLLEIDGPLDMYSGGYRVATPVLAGLMRRIAGVAPLTPTIVLGVGLRVLIPLLLAGFAYRWRRDPLIWHAVALTAASLLPTPPFAGYLDNVLTLVFLSTALYLLEPARRSWPARFGLGVLLAVCGFTHPTTLAIFVLTLGVMAVTWWMLQRFSVRSAWRHDGPMLVTALIAAVAIYGTWKIGIWGEPASLSESALPPPAGADFYKTRLGDWLGALRLPFNGPLFIVGIIGLLASGLRAFEEEFSRVSLIWLAPLFGLVGALVGLSYPYYRFFNTTTAWMLLIGLGAYFIVRYCFDVAGKGGPGVFALIGVLILGVVVAGNFQRGLEQTHWNDVTDAWIKPDERRDLESLRSYLVQTDAPVVFVADDEAAEPVRIYGFAKRVGNVSRFAVPASLQDETAFYIGSLEQFRRAEPTQRGPYYDDLSAASLEDVERVTGGEPPTIVVARVFNETGANSELGPGEGYWFVDEGRVQGAGFRVGAPAVLVSPSPVEKVRPYFGILLLIIPGALFLRWLLPDAHWSDALGLVPALSSAIVTLIAIATLAVTGSALTTGLAWLALGVATALGTGAFLWAGFRGDQVIARKDPAFSEL